MILYHGTSTEHLPRILMEGILPRAESSRRSNFDGLVESKSDLVYLSDAYPLYFALNATDESYDPVILQVQVEPHDLLPDEDFIAYHLSQDIGSDWTKTISEVNPRDYQHHWEDSLKGNGTVATPRVQAKAILKHKVVPFAGNEELLLMTGGDSMPTVLNYSLCGSFYRECTAALFKHELSELKQVVEDIYETHQRTQFGEEFYEKMKEMMDEVTRLNNQQ